MNDGSSYFCCPVVREKVICTFKCNSQKLLLSHYRVAHRGDVYFRVPCFYEHCPHKTQFYTEDALRKHLSLKHKEFFAASQPVQHQQLLLPISSEPDGHDTTIDVPNENLVPTAQKESQLTYDPAFHVLSLLADRKLNQADLQHVMKITNDLVKQAVTSAIEHVVKKLEDTNCNNAEVKDITENYLFRTMTTDLFAGIESQYGQEKYFVNKFGMILPQLMTLPRETKDHGRSRTNKAQQIKKQSYVTVSIIRQVEVQLNKKDINNQVFGTKHNLEEYLQRFEDGTAYQNSSFFQAHPCALQIHLYIDEVQMCRELGSKVQHNKLVFVYFTLGNLEPKFRTTLKQIHLVAVFKNLHVKSYGLNLLLKPIVEEIKLLENGVEMEILGEKMTVYGTLAVLTADNLASHLAGGFKTGFSRGFRKCRYCLATRNDIQTKTCDLQFIPRTKDGHNIQSKGMQTTLFKYFGKLYGLNGTSVFNELQHFHVIGGLVPDIMHDFHEGILILNTCLFLLYCIEEKRFFTIEQLNHCLRNFKYGHSEVKDKPSEIAIQHLKNRSLRQSAAQIALIVNMLPIMIGSMVPPFDKKWQSFRCLLEIFRLLMKNSIRKIEVLKLDFLIPEFLNSFKKCYTGESITPKMHFLVHYPRHIRLMGPLGAFWCMRYEAKHSYFKQISRTVGNYINPAWTLAYRHQQVQCKHFMEGGENGLQVIVSTPIKKTFVPLSTYFDTSSRVSDVRSQIADKFSLNDLNNCVATLPWIMYGSVVFKKSAVRDGWEKSSNCRKGEPSAQNTVVLCPLQGKIKAAFGKITEIFEHNGQYAFLCQILQTVKFDQQFQAYHVRMRKDRFKMVVTYKELIDHRVYHLQRPVQMKAKLCYSNKTYIVPKCDLHDSLLMDCLI